MSILKRKEIVGLLVILGAISFLFIYPLLINIYISLFSKHPLERTMGTWVGLENYIMLLEGSYSSKLFHSIEIGAIWAAASVTLQTLLGIGVALLVNEPLRGRSVARSLLLLPYMIPTVIATLVWKWLLNDVCGLYSYILKSFGVGIEGWFGPNYAMFSLTLVAIWEFFPFVMLCVLAGLQSIPVDLYDAASVDGASSFQRFIHVTLPGLRNVLFITVLLRIIWMFNKFDLVWLLTQGGPVDATQNLPVLSYDLSFIRFRMGLGTASATLMFVILLCLAFIYFKVYKVEI